MNTPFRKLWPAEAWDSTNARPVRPHVAKATVFRALRSKLGGRPLPAAGGQPRRCTGVRPNPFLAVGSRNYFLKSPGRIPNCRARPFQVLSKGHRPIGKHERPDTEIDVQPVAQERLLQLGLGA